MPTLDTASARVDNPLLPSIEIATADDSVLLPLPPPLAMETNMSTTDGATPVPLPPPLTIANTNTNTATYRHGQPSSSGSFFSMPSEIRRMVYGYLIPDPKKVEPMGWYKRPSAGRVPGPKRWELHVLWPDTTSAHDPHSAHSKPVLTRICSETRSYMLELGTFIFATAQRDGGMWWNPAVDTLVFRKDFFVRYEQAAFDDVAGLQHVENLELDDDQAMQLAYKIQYKSDAEMAKPAAERDISAVDLCFLGRADDFESENWLMRYFPAMRKVTVPLRDYMDDVDYTAEFKLYEEENEARVKDTLRRYREGLTWVREDQEGEPLDFVARHPTSASVREDGHSMAYFIKPGRQLTDDGWRTFRSYDLAIQDAVDLPGVV